MIAGAATGFRPLDWAVVVFFLLWMLWIGYRSGRRNPHGRGLCAGRPHDEPRDGRYFALRDAAQHASYLSYPGEMVKYGPVVFIGLRRFRSRTTS